MIYNFCNFSGSIIATTDDYDLLMAKDDVLKTNWVSGHHQIIDLKNYKCPRYPQMLLILKNGKTYASSVVDKTFVNNLLNISWSNRALNLFVNVFNVLLKYEVDKYIKTKIHVGCLTNGLISDINDTVVNLNYSKDESMGTFNVSSQDLQKSDVKCLTVMSEFDDYSISNEDQISDFLSEQNPNINYVCAPTYQYFRTSNFRRIAKPLPSMTTEEMLIFFECMQKKGTKLETFVECLSDYSFRNKHASNVGNRYFAMIRNGFGSLTELKLKKEMCTSSVLSRCRNFKVVESLQHHKDLSLLILEEVDTNCDDFVSFMYNNLSANDHTYVEFYSIDQFDSMLTTIVNSYRINKSNAKLAS